MSDEYIRDEITQIQAIDPKTLLSTESAPYGLTETGYIAKPYGRLVSEGLAMAQYMFGENVDLSAGSVIRKLIEMTAIENARTYAMLGRVIDNMAVPTAIGEALGRLGQELGLPRPFNRASGRVKLIYKGIFTDSFESFFLPAGSRMLTSGGHHVALDESAKFTAQRVEMSVRVSAFHPGHEHNLDPSKPEQKINLWNHADQISEALQHVADGIGADKSLEDAIEIKHEEKLVGGEIRWADDRYRQMLLRAPRSIWTVEAMQLAVALVPGVRQVKIVDLQGGLDIDLPIFGGFNFGDRVFGTERDIASPYYFTVLVAPTPSAIWDGPDGLAALIAETLEDLRPIGIFPEIREANEVNIGVKADIIVDAMPLPAGDIESVNNSRSARDLKSRIIKRIQGYINALGFGEQISPAKVTWAIMSETGVGDVRNLTLTRYPAPPNEIEFGDAIETSQIQELGCGVSFNPEPDTVAVYVDDHQALRII